MANFTINWTNPYPGIEHGTGANAQYATNDVNILKVDLTHPKITFLTTPFAALNGEGVKTTEFLNAHFSPHTMQAMYATNANFFDISDPDSRNVAYGLVVSQGEMIAYPYSHQSPFGIVITEDNGALIGSDELFDLFAVQMKGKRPYTAVAGNHLLVQNGISVAPPPAQQPIIAARTAIGLSQVAACGTPQFLFLVTIDGRDEYSNMPPPYYGATYQDVANWLLAAGAYNAINLDGGGSTTMATINGLLPPPQAILLNQPHDDESSSAVTERKVAVSFGVVVKN